MPKRPSEITYHSPSKIVTTGKTEFADMNFHVIPDVHGNYLTLINQCMQSIKSFNWDKDLIQKYTNASKSNKENVKSFINNQGHYSPNFVEIAKDQYSEVYNKIDGHNFIQDLKKDLDEIEIDEADKSNEMVFAGDLLADRETNTLHMLYTFKACRSMSSSPMYMSHPMSNMAQAVAVATPCCPAPVSAITRVFPSSLASSACPKALLILCAPV